MNIFKTIGEDIQAVKERDPAAQNSFVIWLTYPGCTRAGRMWWSTGCGITGCGVSRAFPRSSPAG